MQTMKISMLLSRFSTPKTPKREPLDPEVAKRLLKDATDNNKQPWCTHCGWWHLCSCPRVRRLEWRGGEIVSVEFWPTWDHGECYSQLEVAEAASEAESTEDA